MRCPIHKGDNPTSFSINEKTGFAKCFRCGWSGGKLELIVELGLALNRKQAFQWAAEQMGVSMDGFDPRQREIYRRLRLDAIRMRSWQAHRVFSAQLFSTAFREAYLQLLDEAEDDWRPPSIEEQNLTDDLERRWEFWARQHYEWSHATPAATVSAFRAWETSNGPFQKPKYVSADDRAEKYIEQVYTDAIVNKRRLHEAEKLRIIELIREAAQRRAEQFPAMAWYAMPQSGDFLAVEMLTRFRLTMPALTKVLHEA